MQRTTFSEMMPFNRKPQYKSALVALGVSLFATGCQTVHKSHVETSLQQQLQQQVANEQKAHAERQASLQQLPPSVSAALQAPPAPSDTGLFGSDKYDINAQSVDASAFFAGLVTDTPYSVAIHPEVSGSISMNLKQVSLDQVFDLVGELYGFDIDRQDTIYRVRPAGMRTETFNINYLLMQRDGAKKNSNNLGGGSR